MATIPLLLPREKWKQEFCAAYKMLVRKEVAKAHALYQNLIRFSEEDRCLQDIFIRTRCYLGWGYTTQNAEVRQRAAQEAARRIQQLFATRLDWTSATKSVEYANLMSCCKDVLGLNPDVPNRQTIVDIFRYCGMQKAISLIATDPEQARKPLREVFRSFSPEPQGRDLLWKKARDWMYGLTFPRRSWLRVQAPVPQDFGLSREEQIVEYTTLCECYKELQEKFPLDPSIWRNTTAHMEKLLELKTTKKVRSWANLFGLFVCGSVAAVSWFLLYRRLFAPVT